MAFYLRHASFREFYGLNSKMHRRNDPGPGFYSLQRHLLDNGLRRKGDPTKEIA
jgi:hypothetical protein